jgi:transcription antitermination protein NusB
MVRTRRDARERALSLCYELDVRNSSVDDLLVELPVAPAPYAVELARGVEEHRDEIDAIISKFADRWSIDRMPVIDRNLLRIAVYELGWRPEIPLGVAISEAVDLAKRYSTDDSGRFINGMLGRIGEHLRDYSGGDPRTPGTDGAP